MPPISKGIAVEWIAGFSDFTTEGIFNLGGDFASIGLGGVTELAVALTTQPKKHRTIKTTTTTNPRKNQIGLGDFCFGFTASGHAIL